MAADDSTILYRKPLPPSDSFLYKNKKRKPVRKVSSCTAIPLTDTNEYINEPHIYPLHPKGPRPLPMGKIFRHTRDHSSLPTLNQQPFTFNDFLLPTDEHKPLIKSTQCTISRDNYLKMTSWFAVHVPNQSVVHTQLLEMDQIAPKTRKPVHQILLEFQSMFTHLLSQVQSSTTGEQDEQLIANKDDTLIQRPRSSFFCGENRSSSPFDESSSEEMIGPSEMAVLNSMLHGGRCLSLKAHFLTQIPSLLPLVHTLTHLNLSFNCIQVFPSQICQLIQLRELHLRNNPIKDIPSAIKSLQNLKLLSIPFNLLSDLPPGLFELTSLQHLDVSHNSLQWISRDIAKLKNLKVLFVQCNQLTGLPATALSLSLVRLNVESNYFHQMLWKENTHNTPQLLSDLCCIILTKMKDQLPPTIQSLLNRPNGVCDYCEGPLYGCGLRVIRSIKEYTFRVRHLPFIFQVCSIPCYQILITCDKLNYNHIISTTIQ